MAIPFAIAAGIYSDKISPKYTFPFVYAFRFVIMFLYCFVTDPAGWLAYTLSIFLLPAGYQMFVVVQGFLAKRFPKDIRGTMFSIMSLTIAIACVIYAALGTWLFYIIGPCAIYLIIAVCDLAFLIWVTILIMMGKFGYQNKKRLASMSETPFDASIKISVMDKITEDVDENTNTLAESHRENSMPRTSANFGGNLIIPSGAKNSRLVPNETVKEQQAIMEKNDEFGSSNEDD